MRNCRWILVVAIWGFVFAGVASGQITATVTLPDTTAKSGDTVAIPITVSTNSTIGLAQFVVEFDSTIINFKDAVVGKDVPNFMVSLNPNLPFPTTASGTNENVLIQLSGGGAGSFTGQGKEVAKLQFVGVKSSGKSPLVFDQAANHTFLTTTDLKDITGSNITFVNGSLEVGPTNVKIGEETTVPCFALHQNYPNPFNPSTTIQFAVKEKTHVILKLYNLMGQEVLTLTDAEHHPGVYEVTLKAEHLASGIYLYKIQMGAYSSVKKMIMVK